MAKKKEKKSKTKIPNVKSGRIYIYSNYNNCLLTFTDNSGNVIAWSSPGRVGFKGARKSTPYASQKAAAELNDMLKRIGVEEVDVYLRGPGIPSKQLVIRELASGGYRINAFVDNNRFPHGGVTPRKKPRK